MAEHDSEYHHGQMDVRAQQSTFHLFNGLTKWGSLHLAVLLVFLVLWFCTKAGFLGALVTAVVVMVLGILLLREKPSAGH
jgi:predicted anti-sigma-YlaC factor YlaD